MKNEFNQILFRTAFCCMTCDGHIDETEIEEIHKMDKNTSYFGEIDVSRELEKMINDLRTIGNRVIENLFSDLRKTKLNTIQELLVLEVTLRIIHADEKVDENELRFLRLLRGRLEVHDETIIERFGKDVLLFDKDYQREIEISEKEYLSGIKLPDLKEIDQIDISNFKKPG